jgi:hypothetical protein
MRKSIFYLNILVLVFLFVAAKVEAVESIIFEQTYYRGTGSPVTETGSSPNRVGELTVDSYLWQATS